MLHQLPRFFRGRANGQPMRLLTSLITSLALLLPPAAVFAADPEPAPDPGVGCVENHWNTLLDQGPQDFELRQRLPHDDGEILAIAFGPLAGEFAKVYLFLLNAGDCYTDAVVIGSYEATNQYAREIGEIGEDERVYHADHYLGDQHQTLGFYRSPPTFEQATAMALEAFAD